MFAVLKLTCRNLKLTSYRDLSVNLVFMIAILCTVGKQWIVRRRSVGSILKISFSTTFPGIFVLINVWHYLSLPTCRSVSCVPLAGNNSVRVIIDADKDCDQLAVQCTLRYLRYQLLVRSRAQPS